MNRYDKELSKMPFNAKEFGELILKEKMPVIKDLGGGSSSYTFLSKKNNRNAICFTCSIVIIEEMCR